MSNNLDSIVSIDFRMTCQNEHEVEYECISEYDGIINGRNEDDEVFPVGKVKVFKVFLGKAIENGYSIFDLFDIREEVSKYVPIIDFDVPRVSQELCDKYDLFCVDTLIILHRLEIEPTYRAQGYGEAALKLTLNHLGTGCELAVLKVFPLQFEASEDSSSCKEMYVNFKCTKVEATDKLVRYYKQHGFELFNSQNIMVKPIV